MKLPRILLIILMFASGFGAGTFFARSKGPPCDIQYKYINGELACGGASYIVSKEGYAELKQKIEQFIRAKTDEGKVSNVAIYFRDLENGPTLGINEHDKFVPASLLKVPRMLTYLRLAEEDPQLLQKQLVFRIEGNESPVAQWFPSKETIQENKPYTIDDLLGRMIIYSDNRAVTVLKNYLAQIFPNADPLFETLNDLGILTPRNSIEDAVTVKSYASTFVQLYHVSFFSKKETSEKALTWLAQTQFDQGLESGVSRDIEVAHKFGERFGGAGEQKQLHDCGIVYYPRNPYLLCVMTRGDDFAELTGAIAEISQMFYEEFDSRKL